MSVPPPLQRLAGRIAAAVALAPGPMALEIQATLRDSVADNTWLPPERRRASHDNYARHLLYGDPAGRFSILSLVWDHGQMSPIHGHHTWCAVGVYSGELTETFYREGAAGGPPVAERTVRRGAGSLSFDAALSGIHRLGNDSGAVAVSLHVYGVAADRISTGVNRIYA